VRKARLLVGLPDEMSPAALRELLAMNGVAVYGWETCVNGTQPGGACRPGCDLSTTERAVLRAFTCCDTNEEIARQLGISPETVKTHVKSLYRKLRVRSRAYAVGRALRLGLLTVDDLVPPPNGGNNPPHGG
jgi:DNA-binding NarL/FixJ family response regulator